MPSNIVISVKSILALMGVLVSGWLLYQVRDVVLIVFVSLIFTLTLDPLVAKLEVRLKKRVIAVFLVVLATAALFGTVASLSLKAAIDQTVSFAATFPSLIQGLLDRFGYSDMGEKIFLSLTGTLASSGSGGVVMITKGVFSNVLAIFSIFVFTFYFLVDFERLRDTFLSFFDSDQRVKVQHIFDDVEKQLGSWLRGQLFLMLIIGLMSFVGLSLLGIKYAFPLAFLAGLLEVVPNIGPTLSAVPAILVGWAVSPWLALGTLALYVLIQQLENNFIVPKIMQKVLGFNPLTTILAILIGGKLLGVIGAVLALPTLLIIVISLRHITDRDIKL
ncbi:hypothetical protein COX24_00305 [bacterium (Candidatus Gribaldobacteria) CG23_combo_of_CG06-09_8_20_14_all_37_87_8]|uniref:AI-2E family transporter n=2 Tax=Bacteria candidate phyla TaxID=1783234 RepID=A0A2H0XA13_UNCKA|nr:MAG: hypothetical protein COX24_00305 [bacterium (Candidatus Gribaldobacteria) CG23_combo_of_CG06-09_8_20_14_all_37_87_8]PIS20999.1 MAG: hypothetical protein COT52_00835 [candidate division WWE3 bacterium CG08_land_8_20_14_0_20_43_13]